MERQRVVSRRRTPWRIRRRSSHSLSHRGGELGLRGEINFYRGRSKVNKEEVIKEIRVDLAILVEIKLLSFVVRQKTKLIHLEETKYFWRDKVV